MTAKEKAKELVNKFYQPLGYLKCGVNSDTMWEHGKQCALIAVDEILELLDSISNQGAIGFTSTVTGSYVVPDIEYLNWQEVKQNIIKL